MNKTILLGTTALVALFASSASAAPGRPTLTAQVHRQKHIYVLPHRNSTVLYDQSAGSNGIGIVSQNFEPTFSIYDANGADDFPALGNAKIKEVVANGTYFNGSGPADSFDVILYKKINWQKRKAKIQATCTGQSYTDLNGSGYPDIKLKHCQGKTGDFDRGGWVAVIANLAFQPGGEWGWNTNNTVNGNPSLWRCPNPDCNSAGVERYRSPIERVHPGCWDEYYGITTECIPIGEGGDFAFALLGH